MPWPGQRRAKVDPLPQNPPGATGSSFAASTAWRWLVNIAALTPIVTGIDDYALVDIDDTIKEVHGYQKQGSGYGYSEVRGLNALLGIV